MGIWIFLFADRTVNYYSQNGKSEVRTSNATDSGSYELSSTDISILSHVSGDPRWRSLFSTFN